MKIAFTICSNNYLSQARTLADSIKESNPDYFVLIGLVDRLINDIDYGKEIGYTIIPVEEISIPDFDSLWKKYTILELNTCVRPFYFEYIISKYPDWEYLFYLDPDTFVFNDLKIIENEFTGDSKILITPHILSPLAFDGKKRPNEIQFLKFGIFNLGFLGLKHSSNLKGLIDWWKERMYHYGYASQHHGLYVDQLWFNLVPILFQDVRICRNPGLNMAPWNLHERTLSKVNNKFFVNGESPLLLFHFSDYKYTEPNLITQNYNRFNFEIRPDLIEAYNIYQTKLIGNNISCFSKTKPIYLEMRSEYLKRSKYNLKYIINILKSFIPPIFDKLFLKLKN